MTDDRWTSIGEPAALTDALVQFRWAARFAVSAGQTFAEPRPDGGHRTLAWDDRRRALLSAPFAGAYPFRVGVRPEDLTLLFLDRTEHPLAALPLEGHTTAEGFDWLGVGVATYLGGAPPLFERPEDPMPAHPVQDGMPFRLDVDAGRAVAALYGAAAALLGEVAGARGPAEVVCRPGLLSLEAEFRPGKTAPPRSRPLTVGFAPDDGERGGWRFYARPHVETPGSGADPSASDAVLSGQAVRGYEPDTREARIRAFFARAVSEPCGQPK